MKKLVFMFAALFAVSFISCTGESQQDGQQTEDSDSVATEVAADTAQQVTGVAIDGAMNSVYLKAGDDTLEFSYPDLDGDHRQSWEIDDTLTIRYVVTEDGDSVTDVINETA